MRRLSADEAAAWKAVAGSVRPLRSPVLIAQEPRSSRAKSRDLGALPRVSTALDTNGGSNSKVKPQRPSSNTLDSTWDKSLAIGRVEPDFTIDLHGETLSTAHARLNRSLDFAIRQNVRVILLITGKPQPDNPRLPPTSRGVIRASVKDWLAASPHASRIAAIRAAHPRHGGAGALYLILRRAR